MHTEIGKIQKHINKETQCKGVYEYPCQLRYKSNVKEKLCKAEESERFIKSLLFNTFLKEQVKEITLNLKTVKKSDNVNCN